MFAPFILHLLLIFLESRSGKSYWEGFKKALQHFPLVIPVTNLYHAYQLSKVEYSDPMSVKSLSALEDLKMKAGQLTLTEAFLVRSCPGL